MSQSTTPANTTAAGTPPTRLVGPLRPARMGRVVPRLHRLADLSLDSETRAPDPVLEPTGALVPVGELDHCGLGLSPDADLARRAAACLGQGAFGALAARAGVPPRQLVRMARAWELGGEAGVEVLGPPRPVPPDDLQEARAAAAASGEPVRVQGNRVTAGGVQLRLGIDGRWYPFTRVHRQWELAGAPDLDPARFLRPEARRAGSGDAGG